MTHTRSDERRKLVSLSDALFEDLITASDEDILNEVAEAGGDGAAISNQMRAGFKKTVAQSRKERMKEAKADSKAAQVSRVISNVVDISTARHALKQAFNQEGLSMAARNETESDLTDEEVLRKYCDLIRLGVIDPDKGNT